MVEYVIEGKMAVIIGCTSDEVEVIIPEVIENYRVSKIQENAFLDLPNLTKVIIPRTVKVIGAYAFSGCKNLQNVVFNEGLETIEDWAFSGCGVITINFPKTLKFLGNNSFLGAPCKSKIKSLIKKRENTDKAIHLFSNNSVILPTQVLENLESLNNLTIDNMNYNILGQLNSLNDNYVIDYLDLPFLFNGSRAVISFYSKNVYENLNISVNSESLDKIGVYEDNNDDYLLVKLDISDGSTLVNNGYFITPFCDSFKLVTEEISYYQVEEDINVYLITFGIETKHYGSGNPDREFALNVIEQYRNKYKIKFQNHIIDEETYLKIDDEINDIVYSVTKEFLKGIKKAPYLDFINNIVKELLKEDKVDQRALSSFMYNRIINIYSHLSDFDSFEEICFNIDEAIEFAKEQTNLSLGDIRLRYNVEFRSRNKILSEEDLVKARDNFVEVEQNYELYLKVLNKIFMKLQKLENELTNTLCVDYLEFFNRE